MSLSPSLRRSSASRMNGVRHEEVDRNRGLQNLLNVVRAVDQRLIRSRPLPMAIEFFSVIRAATARWWRRMATPAIPATIGQDTQEKIPTPSTSARSSTSFLATKTPLCESRWSVAP